MSAQCEYQGSMSGEEHTQRGKWSEAGVPHRGWTCIGATISPVVPAQAGTYWHASAYIQRPDALRGQWIPGLCRNGEGGCAPPDRPTPKYACLDRAAPGAHLRLMEEKDVIRETGVIAYVLYGVSIIASPAVLAGVIYVYMKRDAMRGTWAEGHMTWLIRTFWLAIAASLVSVVLSVVVIGFFLLGLVWLWFVYRVVKGFVAFNDGQPIADPDAYL
jgi:uncharacterized membrane protein